MTNFVLGGLLVLVMGVSVYPLALFANLTTATDNLAKSNVAACQQNTDTARTLQASGQCDLAARIVEDGSSADPALIPDTSVALPAPNTVTVVPPGQPYVITPDDRPGDVVALPAPTALPDVAPAPAQSAPVAAEPASPVVVPAEPAPQPQPEPQPAVEPTPAPQPEPTPEPEPEPTTEPQPEPTTEPTPETTTEPTQESTPDPEPAQEETQEPTPSENNDDNGTVTEDLSDTVTDTVDNVGDILS